MSSNTSIRRGTSEQQVPLVEKTERELDLEVLADMGSLGKLRLASHFSSFANTCSIISHGHICLLKSCCFTDFLSQQ